MSLSDLRITEVMYNPAPGAFEYIEVTNTGDTTVSSQDFFIGNSDFGPTYFEGTFGPDLDIPAGASIILVPVLPDFTEEVFEPPTPVTQAEFEGAYGPLPAGAVFMSYPAFFGPAEGGSLFGGDRTYTIGAIDLFIDSVYIEGGAAVGQSVDVSDEMGETITVFGAPTPGSTGDAPPPPPEEGELILGDDTSETLLGTGRDDSIFGGQGDDSINGRGGDDFIDGGNNEDTISAGGGNDEVYGGDADDSITGGSGEDLIFGGSGGDIITGGADNDLIFGGHGWDDLRGGGGNDEIYGGVSNDLIGGGAGDDILFGGRGNDTLRGGADNDELYGGTQSDTLNGGSGDDLLEGGRSDDLLIGGTGADTFVFAGTTNRDMIADFEVGIDKIDITAMGPMTELELTNRILEHAGNAIINLGSNGRVVLNDIAPEDLTLDDFIYFLDDIFIAT